MVLLKPLEANYGVPFVSKLRFLVMFIKPATFTKPRSIFSRPLLKPGTGRDEGGTSRPVPPTKIRDQGGTADCDNGVRGVNDSPA